MRSVFTFIFLFSISIPGFSQTIYYLPENHPVDNLSLSIMSNGSVRIKNTTEGTYGHFSFLLKGKKGSVIRRGPLQNGRADISALAAGMYIVRIQQKEQTYNGGKLIIAR